MYAYAHVGGGWEVFFSVCMFDTPYTLKRPKFEMWPSLLSASFSLSLSPLFSPSLKRNVKMWRRKKCAWYVEEEMSWKLLLLLHHPLPIFVAICVLYAAACCPSAELLLMLRLRQTDRKRDRAREREREREKERERERRHGIQAAAIPFPQLPVACHFFALPRLVSEQNIHSLSLFPISVSSFLPLSLFSTFISPLIFICLFLCCLRNRRALVCEWGLLFLERDLCERAHPLLNKKREPSLLFCHNSFGKEAGCSSPWHRCVGVSAFASDSTYAKGPGLAYI